MLGRWGLTVVLGEAGGIEVCNVAKHFESAQGRIDVLEDMSLTVREGEFLSILGPSGCGKSTLLSLVAGLQPPTSGFVVVDGKRVERKPPAGIGMIFQRDALLPWRNVLDNVMVQVELIGVGRRERGPYRERARELLRMVGLEGFEKAYPRQLSGGMRQRVAICRALVHSPHVLLMDEPFGALDALTREQLQIDTDKLCKDTGVTVLLVTHSIDEAIFLGDEVAVFSQRPASLVGLFPVNIPRPRPLEVKEEPAFVAVAGKVRECFKHEGILREHV